MKLIEKTRRYAVLLAQLIQERLLGRFRDKKKTDQPSRGGWRQEKSGFVISNCCS